MDASDNLRVVIKSPQEVSQGSVTSSSFWIFIMIFLFCVRLLLYVLFLNWKFTVAVSQRNPQRYTSTDLNISLYVWLHIKTIPWKFRILKPKNSRVIYPCILFYFGNADIGRFSYLHLYTFKTISRVTCKLPHGHVQVTTCKLEQFLFFSK